MAALADFNNMSSAEELSDTDIEDSKYPETRVLLVHLQPTSSCENYRTTRNSEDIKCDLCDISQVQCGDGDQCHATDLRTCLFCQGLAYLLPSHTVSLILKDVLDCEGLSQILKSTSPPLLLKVIKVLSGGNLQRCPDNVDRFFNLKKLIIRRNHITELPASMKKLGKLQVLDLAHNDLSEIPDVIFDLETLVQLNLKDNKIRFIGSAFLDLKQLKVFCVKENPLVSPSSDVCDAGIQAICTAITKYIRK